MRNILGQVGDWLSNAILKSESCGVEPFDYVLFAKLYGEGGKSDYALLLLNDDTTPMDYVIEIFCQKFRMSRSDATELMLKIDADQNPEVIRGDATVLTEAASLIEGEANRNGYGLKCQVIPVNQ